MPLKRPPKPMPTPPAPPEPTKPPAKPEPSPITTLGAPTGTIGGDLHIAYGRGADWSKVNYYDPLFVMAGTIHQVPPQMLKAMAVIESGGEMIPNQGGSGAWGIMQFKRSIWQRRADPLGYDLNTPEGQIFMAAAILGGAVAGVPGSTPEERFLSTYYPTAGLDVPGEDGHTPRQYLADMHELMRQIDAAVPGEKPEKPKPVGDVIAVIVGGKPTNTSYGFKSPAAGDYYGYFEGHGGTRYQHTGIDATGQLGQPLFTPIDGTVVCAGTGVGQGAHGSSCAAFADEMVSGVGRIEVITDDGTRSLIFGHCGKSLVRVGQRVDAGQQVATMGGAGNPPGPHCHVEARIWRNGDYTIVDPRQAFGDGPLPVIYAERVDIPQPSEFDVWATVRATRDGVPVLQRADLNAAPVREPLKNGEEFEAVYQVIGNDKRIYWVTRLRSRVPVDGTESDDWRAA